MSLRDALLSWYRAAGRKLVFRDARDPYAIWVSEVMAQQTRITALLPYYERFMRAYPDVASLAGASEHDVLKMWEGLGYYSRARSLHGAARIVNDHYGGRVPDTWDALRRLPGVGDYTAGAILSIAFGRRCPAVDGNVLRVWARLHGDDTDISLPAARRAAASWVSDLMPEDSPGDMTQALMDLGALICAPKSPRCGECPVAGLCAAWATGRQGSLPVRPPKKAQRREHRAVLMVFDPAGQVLMRRRHEALLRGMWEFPPAPPHGMDLLSRTPCGTARHTFTHIIWEMEGFLCQAAPSRAALPEGWVWANADRFATLAVPSAFRAFARIVGREMGKGKYA
ncbi:MAG: A/G-specific adenine glycosylase [Oscillospiraceae bacterium]|nr:A/G-specific adenine glycosylase [Oscillospiraceae bacterium]